MTRKSEVLRYVLSDVRPGWIRLVLTELFVIQFSVRQVAWFIAAVYIETELFHPRQHKPGQVLIRVATN